MPEQLSFDGFGDAGARTDRLIFLIYPDSAVAEQIAGLILGLAARHQLRGRPTRRDILHITLNNIGEFAGLPTDLVALARQAALNLIFPPFEVVFDRVGSFQNTSGNQPFVLQSAAFQALAEFRAALVLEMKRTGSRLGKQVQSSFTPHITLLRDHQSIVEQPIAPIAWTVREFVLVHSLIGQTKHVVLGRWPLRG